MKPEWPRRALAVPALLLLGIAMSHIWMRRPGGATAPAISTVLVLRPLDLTIQLGLMLVSALGIRALLPGNDDPQDGPNEDL